MTVRHKILRLLNRLPAFHRMMAEDLEKDVDARFANRAKEIALLQGTMQDGLVVIDESVTPDFVSKGLRVILPAGIEELECHSLFADVFEDLPKCVCPNSQVEFSSKYGFEHDTALDRCWSYLQSISANFVLETQQTNVYCYGEWNLALSCEI